MLKITHLCTRNVVILTAFWVKNPDLEWVIHSQQRYACITLGECGIERKKNEEAESNRIYPSLTEKQVTGNRRNVWKWKRLKIQPDICIAMHVKQSSWILTNDMQSTWKLQKYKSMSLITLGCFHFVFCHCNRCLLFSGSHKLWWRSCKFHASF